MRLPDPKRFAEVIVDRFGGHDEAKRRLELNFEYVRSRWDQDIACIGRILRAHLFVEHFLTMYLQVKNAGLADLDGARLSFAQKLSLLPSTDRSIADLIPGIQHLNKLRNRLAHTLLAQLSEGDRDVFLSNSAFRELRIARDAPRTPSSAPLDVLEDFGSHAGMWLHSAASADSAIWGEAIAESMKESNGPSGSGVIF